MKSKTSTLTKMFLKTSFQKMKSKNFSSEKKNTKSMLILYIIAFAYLGGIIGFMSYQMIGSLMQIHQEQIFLGVILMGVMTLVIFQSIFTSISLFYYSKDNEYILPLPIKPREIIAAKTNVLIITEYAIELVIGLIPLVLYGILTGAGALYYVAMIVVLATFPILPILVASFVVMIIMSFVKFTKNKNRFQLIASLISIIIIIAISFSTSGQQEFSEEQMIQMMNKANSMVQTVKGILPTLEPAIQSLTESSILSIVIALGKLMLMTLVSYGIYMIVAQKIYLKGAVGSLSSGNKTKGKINEKKAFRRSSLAKTYVGKEFKILIRNPIFLMQCILPAVLFPILFVGLSFIQVQRGDSAQMSELIASIGDKTATMVGIVILVIVEFLSMFVYISITAISRDGQNAVFMKYIPVPLMKQLEYKIIPNIIMNTFMNIVTIGILQYVLQLPIIYLALVAIASTTMVVLQSYLMITIDLKKPKLEWDSEYAVVKQNMNLVWPAITGMVNITVLLILGGLLTAIGMSGYISLGIISLLYLGIILEVKKHIERNQTKLFENIY